MKEEEKIIQSNNDGNDGSFTAEEKSFTRKGWWKRKTKGQKASFIASLVILAISLSLFFIWIYSRQIFGDELGDLLLGSYIDKTGQVKYFDNGWQKIANALIFGAFSIVMALFVIAITITIVFFLNFIIFLTTNNRSRKSQTIGSLLKSLVKYFAIIIDLAVILAIFGVDVAGIIAGVGVLTLVIGLGCQTLIQDIISGLFIVFDDYFTVGDIVIIDGFRGTISDIGLKTTKIRDAAGNIKSISNSQITTVANLSRYDTMICSTIGVAYDEDPLRVEAIIANAMPEFAKKIPLITSGPFYKGIDKISASSIDFMILCYAKEADRFQVARDLNKELYLLMREHDIIIPYQQINVNPAHPANRKKVSAEQLEISKKVTKDLRAVPAPKKKKSLLKKTEEAFKDASNVE